MEWKFEKTWVDGGHTCAVYLHPSLLHRCGYVCVADDSPLHGVKYGDGRLDGIDVHGGLTYSDELPEIEGRPWAFGFDCGHFMDVPDVESGIELYGDREEYRSKYFKTMCEGYYDPMFGRAHMWTLADVERETRRLCKQICQLEAELGNC